MKVTCMLTHHLQYKYDTSIALHLDFFIKGTIKILPSEIKIE